MEAPAGYTLISDPDSKTPLYYSKPGDDKMYFPSGSGVDSVTSSQYQAIKKIARDEDSITIPSIHSLAKYKAKLPAGGRKKKRSATKSRPRRSTRSRKVTLRRR